MSKVCDRRLGSWGWQDHGRFYCLEFRCDRPAGHSPDLCRGGARPGPMPFWFHASARQKTAVAAGKRPEEVWTGREEWIAWPDRLTPGIR